MDPSVFVPLGLFAAVAAVFLASYAASYSNRRVVYDTIKVAIERTGQVDPALVEAIVQDRIGPYADLRKGIVLLAVAGAFVVLGFAVGDPDAIRPLAGVAAFPGLVGAAYIAFHFFAPREATV